MRSGVTTVVDNAQSIIDALSELTKKQVFVGIPDNADNRGDSEIGNAAIGFINENGSPAQNIPARPHLKPGVDSVKTPITGHLKDAAQSALEGNTPGALRGLERAGSTAADGVRRYMTITGFTPLAEGTVAARARRGRSGAARELASRAAGNVANNSNAKPLIDTGQYRRSITYVVRGEDADS